MRQNNSGNIWRIILISAVVLAVTGVGVYSFFNMLVPAVQPQATPVVINTPVPTATPIPPTNTSVPTSTATPQPTATSEVPPGGLVYVLEPDINSVGWVQEGEQGNHFGEGALISGVKGGKLYIGAMQFDLSFIQSDSTIFMAELELTGLDDTALNSSSTFEVQILQPEIAERWSRHSYAEINKAGVDDTLLPTLTGDGLGRGQTSVLVFNAAQRSIIQSRLKTRALSLRIDSLFPEGWFSWDSGYGNDSLGQAPKLRLGVIPPPATEAAAVPPGSTPTPTPTFIMITSTPTPENVLTAAAVAPVLTAEATTTGTPTALPANWVTPWVVTPTPTAENAATAQYLALEATAAVVAYGTSTPLPQNMVTPTPSATPTATPVFIVLNGDLPELTPTPTASLTPIATPTIPPALIGKIAFKSNRTGDDRIYVINPDGTGLALLTNPWPYNVAVLADQFSADGRFRVFTKDALRYGVDKYTGKSIRTDAPAIFWYDSLYNVEKQLTYFGNGIAYNGVWSPAKDEVAFISNDSADDEIWAAAIDGSYIRQLTESNERYNSREIGKDTFVPEINGSPSWSPDGSQIVFWSNRDNKSRIWIMNADGSGVHTISKPEYSDWAPVWIKYPGIANNAVQRLIPYIGPYDPFGADRSCTDFATQNEAQAFYYAAGGPAVDLHRLDTNQDGIACQNDYSLNSP